MSSIACNAESQAKGIFSKIAKGGEDDSFRDYLTQALALKLDFKTTQQANEKALRSLIKSSGLATDLKQALQARAAIYGGMLDPSWFNRGFDLGAKADDLRQRRQARAMLIGGVLLVAQLGAHRIRSLLADGKKGVLDDIRPSSVGTAAHFTKALGQAPMLEVMKFVDNQKGEQLINALLQHADDLDYLQELVSSMAKQSSLNPSLNAVAQAYSRRRFTGRFKAEGQSIELDTLVHQSTRSSKDDDTATKTKLTGKSERLCWAF